MSEDPLACASSAAAESECAPEDLLYPDMSQGFSSNTYSAVTGTDQIQGVSGSDRRSARQERARQVRRRAMPVHGLFDTSSDLAEYGREGEHGSMRSRICKCGLRQGPDFTLRDRPKGSQGDSAANLIGEGLHVASLLPQLCSALQSGAFPRCVLLWGDWPREWGA